MLNRSPFRSFTASRSRALQRIALSCAVAAFLTAPALHAQKAAGGRKVLVRVEPEYPYDLKRASIGGHVRMDVTVSPNGAVDSISVTGGNPVLAESAQKAVKKWKYAPSDSWTTLQVSFEFDPHR